MENLQHWSYQVDDDNIGWLYFNRADSRANTLNEASMLELDAILSDIVLNRPTGLIIRSTKSSGFIMGADISEFTHFTSAEDAKALIERGQKVFEKLESLPFSTVAMIEGLCLGGGLELALACRHRIVEDSDKTRLGLPEVKLGIQPGWGGTVRLPEQVGIINAMDMILTGRLLSARAAKKIGLAQEVTPKRLIEKVARYYALQQRIPCGQSVWRRSIEAFPVVRTLLGNYLKRTISKKASKKHYPAPFQIVDNWIQHGIARPQAFTIEAESIGKLFLTDTSKNLVRVFSLQESLKKMGKKIEYNAKHVHVIGAGVMGGDIAAWCAFKGYRVTLQDQSCALIGKAVKRAYALAEKQLKTRSAIQSMMDRLCPDLAGNGIKEADVIIEAITENLDAKRAIFALLETQAKSDAILATNTSTIPLEEIAEKLKNPTRLVGIHFFNPVAKMPLVEIVKGAKTEVQVVERAMAFVRQLDKLPLPVKSAPGFLVNRILLPYMLEAMILLQEGISAPVIDKAAVDFGMPMGPVELADTVGLDICLAALEKLAGTQSINIPTELKEYVGRGEWGRKTGKGFYQYVDGRAIKPKVSSHSHLPTDLSERLVLRILNEAMACLREGIVDSADALDAGCIFGFGFPPFRGGPMAYAEEAGTKKVIEQFEVFQSRYGERFAIDKGWCSN